MKVTAYAIASIALIASAPAAAAEFQVGIGSPIGTPSCGSVSSGVSDTPVARELVCNPGGTPGLLDAQAAAIFGHVGGTSAASHTGGYFGTAFGISTVSEYIDFVTFTSADPLATHTSIAANLAFSGIMNVTESGVAFVNAIWNMDGVGGANLEISHNSGVFNRGWEVASGAISSTTNNALLRTGTFNAPLNTPLRMRLFLNTAAGVAGGGPPQSGSVRFSNSFEVPLGTDAFVLPAGVTANSGTWLVNNRRVGAVGGIPEPETWLMLILGFGAVGAALRQRRQTLTA